MMPRPPDRGYSLCLSGGGTVVCRLEPCDRSVRTNALAVRAPGGMIGGLAGRHRWSCRVPLAREHLQG